MSSLPPLTLNYSNQLASITFNRPEKRNAFSSDMLRLLSDALDELEQKNDHSVLVLRGSNGHFCSGWDFNEFEEMTEKGLEHLENTFLEHLSILNRLEAHSKLVISIVEGSVMGFGFSLMARSDITLCASNSHFAFPELDIGIVPSIVMIDVHRFVNPKTALEWVTSGRQISAEEVAQVGLVSKLIPPSSSFNEVVDTTIKEIAKKSPEAISITKSTFHKFGSLSPSEIEKLASQVAADSLCNPIMLKSAKAIK